MKTFKQVIKNLLPPFIANAIKNISYIPTWSGNYSTWQEAESSSSGYDSPLILEKVRRSLHKVKSGEAAYERDSVTFNEPSVKDTVLLGLLYSQIKAGGEMKVFDFGGSLGSTYYQLKDILLRLNSPVLQWRVIEQEHFVELGNREFADAHLSFHLTLDKALADVSLSKNIFLMSGCIQYLKNPYEEIQRILEKYNFDFILMARLPFHFGSGSRLTVQNVPRDIYSASYPCWFFNEGEFLNAFSGKYDKVLELTSPDECFDFPSEFKGFLFERKRMTPSNGSENK